MTAPSTWRSRFFSCASGRMTAPSTWRSRFFFLRFRTHDGAVYVAVQAVFVQLEHTTAPSMSVFVRLGMQDGAKYVRSSCWLPLQSMWTPSTRASRFGNAGSISMLVMPPLIPSLLHRLCLWAPFCDRWRQGGRPWVCLCTWRCAGGGLLWESRCRWMMSCCVPFASLTCHIPRAQRQCLPFGGAVPCPFGCGLPQL